ncbi:MAG: endonuclease-3 [Candidatus Latescibacterota bacterium]|jgi:endonuclease-3
MPPNPKTKIVAQIHTRLDKTYGGEAWDKSRTPSNPLDNLMRTILSQNTTDENRDRGYHTLRAQYPTWEKVMRAPPEKVQDAIKVAGLAKQKGPAMQNFLKCLHQEQDILSLDFVKEIDTDDAIKLLIQHKGIGLKTAYIVLAFACNQDLCAVDTHVYRIVQRVGIIDEKCSREKAHTELRPLIPKNKARAFHVNLIDLGKTICHARTPNCKACIISDLCQYNTRNKT